MPHIPDPFYVDLLKAISTLEAEVKGLQGKLDELVVRPEIDSIKSEILVHRAVMAGFFASLLTICGWLLATK